MGSTRMLLLFSVYAMASISDFVCGMQTIWQPIVPCYNLIWYVTHLPMASKYVGTNSNPKIQVPLKRACLVVSLSLSLCLSLKKKKKIKIKIKINDNCLTQVLMSYLTIVFQANSWDERNKSSEIFFTFNVFLCTSSCQAPEYTSELQWRINIKQIVNYDNHFINQYIRINSKVLSLAEFIKTFMNIR